MAVLDTRASDSLSKILLFAKAPVLGNVKTRLATDIGDERALILYKAFLLDVLQAVKETRLPFMIFFTPETEKDELISFLGKDYHYKPQEGKDLGERIANAFKYVFKKGVDKAILIGSDTVDITSEALVASFEILEKNDAVVGPTIDGGFYLIGFKKEAFKSRYFENIEWSSNTTFLNLMNNLRDIRYLDLLDEKMDIDTVGDLFEFYKHYQCCPFNFRTIKAVDALKIFC